MSLHLSLSRPAACMLTAGMPAFQFVCHMQCRNTDCLCAGHARQCLARGSSCACTPMSASFQAELPTRRAGAWSPAAHAPGEPPLEPLPEAVLSRHLCRGFLCQRLAGTPSQPCVRVNQDQDRNMTTKDVNKLRRSRGLSACTLMPGIAVRDDLDIGPQVHKDAALRAGAPGREREDDGYRGPEQARAQHGALPLLPVA